MSSHTRGPRRRARKPRPEAPRAGAVAGATARVRKQQPQQPGARSQKGPRPRPAVPVGATYGERPQAPWHPLPLSEILILVGAIAIAVGWGIRSASVPPLLLAGIAAAALGAIEVAWREHRSGYRSHTMLLSFLPVIVFHTLTVLLVNVFTSFPPALNLVLLAVDVALFFALFRVLRARFLDARARAAARR